MKDLSSSEVQEEVEKNVISKLKKKGYNFLETEKSNYKLDVYCEFEGNIIIGEIYAGIRKINTGSRRKILMDCLKLIFIENQLNKKCKKIIFFVDDSVKKRFEYNDNDKRNSWVKDAIEKFEIKLETIDISEEDRQKLLKAKDNQRIGMKR